MATREKVQSWPWLAPLGRMVGAAKDRDLSREEHERQIDEAHNDLFQVLRTLASAPAPAAHGGEHAQEADAIARIKRRFSAELSAHEHASLTIAVQVLSAPQQARAEGVTADGDRAVAVVIATGYPQWLVDWLESPEYRQLPTGTLLYTRLAAASPEPPTAAEDAERWGQQYRCGCFLGFPTKRAIPASCPKHARDKQGGAWPLDAFSAKPAAQEGVEVFDWQVSSIRYGLRLGDSVDDDQIRNALAAAGVRPTLGQDSGECLAAVTAILDGEDTGAGVCSEPWESVRRRLIALAQPVGEVDEASLRAAAKTFYNSTVADPAVTIRCTSPEKRDAVFAAGEKLRRQLEARA